MSDHHACAAWLDLQVIARRNAMQLRPPLSAVAGSQQRFRCLLTNPAQKGMSALLGLEVRRSAVYFRPAPPPLLWFRRVWLACQPVPISSSAQASCSR